MMAANEQVRKVGRGEYLMQLLAAEFDTETGKLTLHSAAGLPAMCIVNGKVKNYSMRGMPLGSEHFTVTSTEVNLSRGDRVMLLTDGIPELTQAANGQPLGIRRVAKLYQQTAGMPVVAAAEYLFSFAREAIQDKNQDDDWTLVLAEWGEPGLRTFGPEGAEGTGILFEPTKAGAPDSPSGAS
jgi:serine phosphatase RsbU (regulator of sigma subunit)